MSKWTTYCYIRAGTTLNWNSREKGVWMQKMICIFGGGKWGRFYLMAFSLWIRNEVEKEDFLVRY